jgi:hypothetical protein
VLRSSRPVDDDEDDDEIEEDDVEDAEDDDDDRVPTSRTLATDRRLLTAGSTSNLGVGRRFVGSVTHVELGDDAEQVAARIEVDGDDVRPASPLLFTFLDAVEQDL